VEAGQRKLVVVFLTAVLTVCARTSPAQDGQAKGQLTLDGESVELTHAYASAKPGFFDKTAEDLRILLSDRPIDEDARTDVFALIGLARAGSIRAVEVIVDKAGQPLSGAFFARGFEGMISVAGVHRFLEHQRSRTRVAGRLWMERPSTFAGVTFEYDATFEAPIPRPPTAEELAGELASAPAKLATAHVSAVIRGDFEAFLSTLTREAAASYRDGGRERFEALRQETPPDSHVVRAVTATPGRATATIEGSRGSIVIEFTLELTTEDGSWRVAP
jgi:hypothetical protein